LETARDRHAARHPEEARRASDLLAQLVTRRDELKKEARGAALAALASVEALRARVDEARATLASDLERAQSAEHRFERDGPPARLADARPTRARPERPRAIARR